MAFLKNSYQCRGCHKSVDECNFEDGTRGECAYNELNDDERKLLYHHQKKRHHELTEKCLNCGDNRKWNSIFKHIEKTPSCKKYYYESHPEEYASLKNLREERKNRNKRLQGRIDALEKKNRKRKVEDSTTHSCTLRLKSIRPFAHFSYKFEIFDWSKMRVKMIEKSPILQKMLTYVGYHSSRNLDPIFSVVLKIRAFEVVSF